MESNYETVVNSKNKMQMLCMRPGTTAEGYNQGREPKNSMHSSTESAIDMCGHGECRTCGRYPLTPTRPPIPDASTAQPVVAQPMNCVSRGNRHFTVGGGRLRQSGPRPEGRLLRQPALEGLTRSARTDSPRKVDRNKSDHLAAAMVVAGGGGGF
ncbi:mitogen-activated protein kinase kinase kinase 7 [Dorcoceras hygrometricum]|uniref:Mitogen-activated protein kinase kinase kinase 7 n=1 Tax=Dorcoceras hygrometricum TaxID=472368 RepID=A0A2Z7CLV4_9LAMI|nr:mitogen-activated protein kinase kinase kinase 7 [Dorcoceras hygrometricum]